MTHGDSQVTEKKLSFAEKLAAAKAKVAESKPAEEKAPIFSEDTANTETVQAGEFDYSADIVTDFDDPNDKQKYSPRDENEQAIDDAIRRLSILDAYRMWCGKSEPKVGNKTEGIMVSCPKPNHPDNHPDAWLNTEKNVWFCGPCQEGGDVIDIAAYHFGFQVPNYKTNGDFPKLKEKIAIDLGFTLVRGMTQNYLVAPETETETQPEPTPVIPKQGKKTKKSETPTEQAEGEQGSAASGSDNTEPAPTNSDDSGTATAPTPPNKDDLDFVPPSIAWRDIVPADTFLYRWLETNTTDYCPEEYHFWTGMMALGFAVGRNRRLWDSRYVTANLFICLSGPSGTGKSIAKERLEDVARMALPYDDDNPRSEGTKVIKTAASAEYLIHEFSAYEDDLSVPVPAGTDPPKIYWPVRGYVDYEELSTLMAVANRIGNPIKSQLMDLYDSRLEVSSGSITGGRRKAVKPYCSVMATTQFTSLKDQLKKGDDGSGFINRWIFASGPAKPRPALGGVVVELKECAKDLNKIKMWAHSEEIIDWSDEARIEFTEFFNKKIVPLQEKSEKAGTAMLGRIDLLIKKFILLLTINNMQDVVAADTVRRAAQLIPYIVKTYGVVHAQMHRTETNDFRDYVLKQIVRLTQKNNGKPPTKREIYLAVHRKISSDKQLVDTLTNLVKLELITETVIKGAGRPTTRYAIQ